MFFFRKEEGTSSAKTSGIHKNKSVQPSCSFVPKSGPKIAVFLFHINMTSFFSQAISPYFLGTNPNHRIRPNPLFTAQFALFDGSNMFKPPERSPFQIANLNFFTIS